MLKRTQENLSENELTLLKSLRVWIVALAVICLGVGVGLGAMLAGRPAGAQQTAASSAAPAALSASFAEVADRVESAVVNIDTLTTAPESALNDEDEDNKNAPDNPLMEMFRRQRRQPAKGIGSGFIVDAKGIVLTNQHVVEGASRITIRLASGEEFRGEVVGVDEETDLAVVRIKADANRTFPSVRLGNSDEVKVGDWVLAIGSPFGLDQTVTAGIISQKERQTPAFTSFQRFLQTDAAINRGNSGGPLVNMRGEVIGVNSQIATTTGAYNGIGFALPSNETKFVYEQIIGSGKVRRGYLGIYLESVRGEFARVYGLEKAQGAIVMDVRDPSGPAGQAGLKASDVIIEYNGQPILNAQDLISRVASTPVGNEATIVYLRENNGKLERRTATVKVGERPRASVAAGTDEDPPEKPSAKPAPKENNANPNDVKLRLGITLEELTPQLIADKKLGDLRGIVVKDIDPSGLVAETRTATGAVTLVEGDIITRINRTPVASLAEFQHIADALKPGDAVVLNVTALDRSTGRLTQRIVQFTFQ